MNKVAFLILFCCASISCMAQLLSAVEVPFAHVTDFEKTYVQRHKIKEIRLSYASKKDGEIIINRGVEKQFLFDKTGLPIQEIYIEQYRNKLDSLISKFQFNKDGNVIEQVDWFKNQQIKTQITFNEQGRIVSELAIEENIEGLDTITRKKFRETYSSPLFAKQFQLNTSGRPFLEKRFYYDNLGRLINLEEDLIISNKNRKKQWQYDGNQLKEIVYRDRINSNTEGKYIFEYLNNCITYIYAYEYGKLIKKTAFVYAVKDPTLLEALVIRYPNKEMIEIITIDYHYY
jgi:antitoxin component YwqK of YwqJK toxin-antitoxin module